MEKQRIQFYTDPETKRRIESAAAKYNIPVSESCLHAVRLQLMQDAWAEDAETPAPVVPTKRTNDTLIADLQALRESILAERSGRPIDVDDYIEQTRAGRDHELMGLP